MRSEAIDDLAVRRREQISAVRGYRKFEGWAQTTGVHTHPVVAHLDTSPAKPGSSHLSSQTSSIRQLLKMLFSIRVSPLTYGCQQVPCLMKKMIGRTASSISLRSICQTNSLRFVGSLSADCRSISASTSGLQPV